MLLPSSVCLSVCPSASLAYTKGYEIFKEFFIYYCDSIDSQKIKRGNPRRRFELCECSLVNKVCD